MELLFALELLFIMFELLFELLVTKIVLSWSNAPYQRCSSGTYGIGMVQCSVPKVLEYARRAVMLKIVSKVVQCVSHGPMLRAHVPKVLEYARVGRMALVWSNAPYQRCSSMRDGL